MQGRGGVNDVCHLLLAYLQLFVCEVLPQLFGHSLQVLKGDPACFIVIEQAESLQDFFFRVLLSLKEKEETGELQFYHEEARQIDVLKEKVEEMRKGTKNLQM